MGRSRGGLTTKIHALTDGRGLPLELILTPGQANIPPMIHRRWKPCFSPVLYRARNRIERFFNRIKHFRRLATRYEKHAANFLAMLKLAAIHLWLRHNESVT